jgi:hypothetical protein
MTEEYGFPLERRAVPNPFGLPDWRDFLNDIPVHNNDFLELETVRGRVTVRYESHRHVAYFVFPDESTREYKDSMQPSFSGWRSRRVAQGPSITVPPTRAYLFETSLM